MPIRAGAGLTSGHGPAYAGRWTETADEQLTIGDITMSGTDEYGVEWELHRLDGWWDGWSGDSNATAKNAAHGAWVSPVWAGPRIVQAEGSLDAGTWDAATLAIRRLIAAVPLSNLTTMTVFTGEGGVPPQQADVRQGGKPVVNRFAGRAEFSLSLLAPDPRIYGVDEQVAATGLPSSTGGLRVPIRLPVRVNAVVTSGRVTVTNDGNETAPVVLEVAGPCPPSTITNLATGQRLVVPEAVPAGRTLTLDSARRTALLDAASSRTVTGTWFDLVPGPNEIAFGATAYEAAARLTIRHRHAWR